MDLLWATFGTLGSVNAIASVMLAILTVQCFPMLGFMCSKHVFNKMRHSEKDLSTASVKISWIMEEPLF